MGRLTLRNLLRNKRRTFLTMSSVALALLLLCVLFSFLAAMERAEGSADNRVIVRNRISLTFSLPEAYEQRLRGVEHVEAVTPMTWYQGVYIDNRPQNFFARFTTDPATLLSVYPEYQISPQALADWQSDRMGFITGAALAEKYGWKIGDQIFIKGDIYPVDVNLTLRGIYQEPNAPAAEKQIFFHRRYLEEALDNPGEAGTYALLIDSPDNLPKVVSSIEAMFENSEARVRAESEEAFSLSFVEMLGNIRLLFGAIGSAIVVSILFITANTMAMAARERTTEVAILKTLGFRTRQVVALVLGESMLVALTGGIVGCALAFVLMPALAGVMQDVFPVFGTLRVTQGILVAALAASFAIGLLAGWFPAFAAARLRIVDGLRRVA